MKRVLILIFVFIAGCQSFNRVEIASYELKHQHLTTLKSHQDIIQESLPKPTSERVIKVMVPTTSTTSVGQCPTYTLPPFDTLPTEPTTKLLSVTNSDQQEIDKILMDYTEELFRYIERHRARFTLSYAEYLKQCSR